jgi:hypothetical protein
MIELPFKEMEPKTDHIDLLVVFGPNKVGKTESLLQLPNSLLIDLEGSGRYYKGTYIDLKEVQMKEGIGPVTALARLAEAIDKGNKEKGSYLYDFISIDSASILEDIAMGHATKLYKKSTIGANFTGEDVTMELPKGAGYLWLRKAFEGILRPFLGLSKTLILVGRVKDSSINKDGEDIEAIDLDLTGKLKKMISYNASGVGIMRRSKDDPYSNILSFKSSSEDLATGARVEHISGKEFIISTKDPQSGKLTTHWDQIFTNLKK